MASLPPHAFHVRTVMEIIFVLFSATTLSLTHIVSSLRVLVVLLVWFF